MRSCETDRITKLIKNDSLDIKMRVLSALNHQSKNSDDFNAGRIKVFGKDATDADIDLLPENEEISKR